MSQATARVTASLSKNLRRRGALPAFLTALGTGLFLTVQSLLGALVSLIGVQQATNGLYELDYTSVAIQGALVSLLVTALPFVFGMFVSLWILAPIADELALRFVIARGILAGVIGSLLVFITSIVLVLVGVFDASGSFITATFPWPSVESGLADLLMSLSMALSYLVHLLPVVILAAVLLWHWLRTHDREHSVSGILDEV